MDAMKTCKRCNATKPYTEFYAHKMMEDGYLSFCKSCTRKRVRKHRAVHLEDIRAYDRERSQTPERKARYAAKNKTKQRHMGPLYLAAHNAVIRAVKRGDIIRPDKCQRCETTNDGSSRRRIQAHHDDYSKPLDVMWLCPACHAQRHVELGRIRTVADD